MESPETCWSLVRNAAQGRTAARDEFALRYESVLRAYLGARWRSTPRAGDIDDAVQEVFVECLKQGGVLERADPARVGGFRAFLYGVARRVALRYETGHGRRQEVRLSTEAAHAAPADEDALSRVFDRALAGATMRDAMRRLMAVAAERGAEAVERVELLRLRFQEGLPIREISARWDDDPARLHRAYAKARAEFQEALLDVLESGGAPSRREAERQAVALAELLG